MAPSQQNRDKNGIRRLPSDEELARATLSVYRQNMEVVGYEAFCERQSAEDIAFEEAFSRAALGFLQANLASQFKTMKRGAEELRVLAEENPSSYFRLEQTPIYGMIQDKAKRLANEFMKDPLFNEMNIQALSRFPTNTFFQNALIGYAKRYRRNPRVLVVCGHLLKNQASPKAARFIILQGSRMGNSSVNQGNDPNSPRDIFLEIAHSFHQQYPSISRNTINRMLTSKQSVASRKILASFLRDADLPHKLI